MVCTFFILSDTLVGGNWGNVSNAGLWYWNVNEASSNAWTTVGARLLIKNIINIRDMVCRARTFYSFLSAVSGRRVPIPVFGIGLCLRLLHRFGVRSVLDLLYRDLVCFVLISCFVFPLLSAVLGITQLMRGCGIGT